MAARQKLETQLTENNIVKEVTRRSLSLQDKLVSGLVLLVLNKSWCVSLQELDLLESTNTVYKLIGPVLVKQDLDEAKATVTKRLEYINGEMWVVHWA